MTLSTISALLIFLLFTGIYIAFMTRMIYDNVRWKHMLIIVVAVIVVGIVTFLASRDNPRW